MLANYSFLENPRVKVWQQSDAKQPVERACGELRVHASSATREGIVDAISMRGLVRVMKAFRSHRQATDSDLDRALVRMINLNAAMAEVVENGAKRK